MDGYHLTRVENLVGEEGIASKGLIPQCGVRSTLVGDERVVVCFTDDYFYLPFWKEELYRFAFPEELRVLTFSINEKDCMKNYREFATKLAIPASKISIASFWLSSIQEGIPFYRLAKYRDYPDYIEVRKTSLENYILEESKDKPYQFYKKR